MVQAKGPWGKQFMQHGGNFFLKLLGRVLTLLKRTNSFYVMVQASQARDSVPERRERTYNGFLFSQWVQCPILITWHSEVAIIYSLHLRLIRTLGKLVCNIDQLLFNMVLSWFYFWGCFCWLENLDKSVFYWRWIFTVENWQFRKMSGPSY